jgi:hypothetical protein
MCRKFLAHLSQSDMVSFCDHFSFVVRPSSVNFYLNRQKTSPHKSLSQFHPNFKGMSLWSSPLKIVQRI